MTKVIRITILQWQQRHQVWFWLILGKFEGDVRCDIDASVNLLCRHVIPPV